MTRYLLRDQTNENAYFNRGNLHFENGDWEQAIADFDQTLAFNKGQGGAYLMRAKSAFYLNRIREGCSDLVKAKALGVQEAKSLLMQYCR